MSLRREKTAALVSSLAATFLNRESNGQSLITVTRCDISPDIKQAKIYITVFPETHALAALNFAKRQHSELREFLKQRARFSILPFVDIFLDDPRRYQAEIEENEKNS